MTITEATTLSPIAQLNDRFRQGDHSVDHSLGHLRVTSGFNALLREDQKELLRLVQAFDQFTEDNDPCGEHDFGSIQLKGEKYFFKIDYYSPDLESGSNDPSDPTQTRRVMTIMHSSEY